MIKLKVLLKIMEWFILKLLLKMVKMLILYLWKFLKLLNLIQVYSKQHKVLNLLKNNIYLRDIINLFYIFLIKVSVPNDRNKKTLQDAVPISKEKKK